jgi:hypothetical protein
VAIIRLVRGGVDIICSERSGVAIIRFVRAVVAVTRSLRGGIAIIRGVAIIGAVGGGMAIVYSYARCGHPPLMARSRGRQKEHGVLLVLPEHRVAARGEGQLPEKAEQA